MDRTLEDTRKDIGRTFLHHHRRGLVQETDQIASQHRQTGQIPSLELGRRSRHCSARARIRTRRLPGSRRVPRKEDSKQRIDNAPTTPATPVYVGDLPDDPANDVEHDYLQEEPEETEDGADRPLPEDDNNADTEAYPKALRSP